MKNAFKISLLALALLSANAQAATQRLDGSYFDVIYDNLQLGLFGTPTLAGNTLFFTPSAFKAKSNFDGYDFSNSTFVFSIEADTGHHLLGATLTERGDYLKLGSSATASVLGETRIVDTNHPEISKDVDLSVTYDPVSINSPLANWTAVSAQSFQSGATKVQFTIENLLLANAGSSNGLAFIEKKYVGLTVSAVPEPESYAMLLAGLGIIGAVVRRKKTTA